MPNLDMGGFRMVLSCLIIQSNCFVSSRDFSVYIPKSALLHFFYAETSSRMDVAPDSGLVDFIETLEEKKVDTSQVVDKEENRIFGETLLTWSSQIQDSEISYNRSEDVRHTIESLRRQQLDGFLTAHDIAELRLWHATSCYTVCCVFVKRDIITYLLELYSSRRGAVVKGVEHISRNFSLVLSVGISQNLHY